MALPDFATLQSACEPYVNPGEALYESLEKISNVLGLEVATTQVLLAVSGFIAQDPHDGEWLWADPQPVEAPDTAPHSTEATVFKEPVLRRAIREQLGRDSYGIFEILAYTGAGKTYNMASLLADLIIMQLRDSSENGGSLPPAVLWVTDLRDNITSPYKMVRDMLCQRYNDGVIIEDEYQQALSRVLDAPSAVDTMASVSADEWQRLLDFLNTSGAIDLRSAQEFNQQLTNFNQLYATYSREQGPARGDLYKSLEQRKNRLHRWLRANVTNCLRTLCGVDTRNVYDYVPKTVRKVLFHLYPGDAMATGHASVLFLTTTKLFRGVTSLFFSYRPREQRGQLVVIDESDRQNQVILNQLLDEDVLPLFEWSRLIADSIHRTLLPRRFPKELRKQVHALRHTCSDFARTYQIGKLIALDNRSSGKLRGLNLSLFDNRTDLRIWNSAIWVELVLLRAHRQIQLLDAKPKSPAQPSFLDYVNAAVHLIYEQLRSLISDAINFYQQEHDLAHELVPFFQVMQEAMALLNLHHAKPLHAALDLESTRPARQSMLAGQYGGNVHERGVDVTQLSTVSSDQADAEFLRLTTTPTGFLADLAKHNQVVLMSATVSQNTVIHNFDRGYLQLRFAGHYHVFSAEQRQALHEAYCRDHDYAAHDIDLQCATLTYQHGALERYASRLWPAPVVPHLEWLLQVYAGKPKPDAYYEQRLCKLCEAVEHFATGGYVYGIAFLNAYLGTVAKQSLFDTLQRLADSFADDVCLLCARADDFNSKTFEPRRDQAIADGKRVLVLTTYKTAGAGKNLQRPVRKDEHYARLNPEREDGYIDADWAYFELPTHLLPVEGPEDYFDEDVLARVSSQLKNKVRVVLYLSLLVQSDQLSLPEAYRLRDAFDCEESAELWVRELYTKFYKDSPDYDAAVVGMLEQALGRLCRCSNKRHRLALLLDEFLAPPLVRHGAPEHPVHETRELFRQARAACASEPRSASDVRSRKLNKRNLRVVRRSRSLIRQLLSRIDQMHGSGMTLRARERTAAYAVNLRELVLRAPAVEQPSYLGDNLYLQMPEAADHYLVRWLGAEIQSSSHDLGLFGASPKGGALSAERKEMMVGADHARLAVLARNPDVATGMAKQGYPLTWKSADFLLNPLIYQAVYLGGLGECVGKILLEAAGMTLQPMPLEQFEFCDGVLVQGSERRWVDFKYFNRGAVLAGGHGDRVVDKLVRKVREHGAPAILLNILGNPTDHIQFGDSRSLRCCAPEQADILIIPALLDENTGATQHAALDAIRRFLIPRSRRL